MVFSNSVIMPRDDFQELVTVAFNQPPTSMSERIATTVQTSTICLGIAGAFGLGSWLWYKAMAKLDKEQTANEIYAAEAKQRIYNQK